MESRMITRSVAMIAFPVCMCGRYFCKSFAAISPPPVVEPRMNITARLIPISTPPKRQDTILSPEYTGKYGVTRPSRITVMITTVFSVLIVFSFPR